MRKGLIAAAVLVALAGAIVAAVPVVETYAAARIKSGMERDGSVMVGEVEIGLFERRVTLRNLT